MARVVRLVSCLLALAPSVAFAQAEFAGKWKLDEAASKLPAKPEVISLQNGVYTCSSCVPAVQAPADGKPHAITPSPYSDAMAVTVVDPMTVKGMRMKNGVVTGKMTETVSADGQSLVIAYEDLTTPSSPVTGQNSFTRIAAGPAGSHAVSGQWRQTAISGTSENGLITDISVNGSNVSMSTPSGQSYTATLDGPQVPYVGDPGLTTVSLARGGPHTVVETDYRNGAVISVEHLTVSPDGHTLTVAVDDKLHGMTATYTAMKQ